MADRLRELPYAAVPVPELNATADIREDVGELGAFARLIVRGPDTMTVASLWEAWRRHNDESTTVTEAGGINKRRLSSALRDHVPGLPAAKAFSFTGPQGAWVARVATAGRGLRDCHEVC